MRSLRREYIISYKTAPRLSKGKYLSLLTPLPSPHTLPPSTILAAHLHPALAEHTSHLHARLQTTQAQNRLLADAVRQQRAEVDDLLRRLEDAAGDVRGANEALDGVVAALAEETRMDAEHV